MRTPAARVENRLPAANTPPRQEHGRVGEREEHAGDEKRRSGERAVVLPLEQLPDYRPHLHPISET